MLSLAGWMLALAAAVSASVIAAAANEPALHMAATGIVTLAIAVVAIRERWQLTAEGASASLIASSTARYLGLVWTWGTLALFITYLLVLEKSWPEWWQFTLGFACAAIVSLAFSNMLSRESLSSKTGASLLKIGRALVYLQIVGMAAGLISLFVDGKFPRDVRYPDWAGCDIFFFGALAIGAICLDSLRAPSSA
jgi:hypothetical protein